VRPLQALLLSPFISQDMGMHLSSLTQEDTEALAALMQSGAVTPVIDRSFPLADTAAAVRYLEEGRARGKVVITVQ
jgi:NADPH:quinone reductase-like Zn-dependent oxidoreductase